VRVGSTAALLAEVDLSDLVKTTLLLRFAQDYRHSRVGQGLLKQTVAAFPIAIAVAGRGADEAFDDLFREVHLLAGKQIMTTLLNAASVDEIVDGFLFGVLPSEERFDEWKTLSIIVVEDDGRQLKQISSALEKWLDGEEQVGGG